MSMLDQLPPPNNPLPPTDNSHAQPSPSPSATPPAGPSLRHNEAPFNAAPTTGKPPAEGVPPSTTRPPSSTAPTGTPAASADNPLQQRLNELGQAPAPPTPEASLSSWLRQSLQQRYHQDIDPDHTFLTSLNYNTGGQPGQGPYPGQIVRQETLTEAALHNTQDPATGEAGNTLVPYRDQAPAIQLTDHLPIKKPSGIVDLGYRYWAHGHDEQADYTYTYEGIYQQKDGQAPRYNAATQLPVDPKDFRAMVWDADPAAVAKHQLDDFWNKHDKTYAEQARLSFFGSAQRALSATPSTPQPGELTPGDGRLAAQLLKPTAEAGIERGRLSVHGYSATDVLYVRDQASERVLLYTPGHPASLHGFDSTAELQNWLAREMKDPARRTAFATHFSAYDRQDGGMLGTSGVDSALAGIAKYPDEYAPHMRKFHGGQWPPATMVTLTPKDGDPFQGLHESAKQRSYQDVDTQVTSDKDVTEQRVKKYLTIVSTVLGAALAPLSAAGAGAQVLSKLALGADLVSSGGMIGIGVDEKGRSKPGWSDDMLNGAMQAVLAGGPKMVEKLAARGAGTTKAASAETSSPAAAAHPESRYRTVTYDNQDYLINPQQRQPDGSYVLYRKGPDGTPQGSTAMIVQQQADGSWKRRGVSGGGREWDRAANSGSNASDMTLSEAKDITQREKVAFAMPPLMKEEPPLPDVLQQYEREYGVREGDERHSGAPYRRYEEKKEQWKKENKAYSDMVDAHTISIARMIKKGERPDHILDAYERYKSIQKVSRDATDVSRHAEEAGMFKLNTVGMKYFQNKEFAFLKKIPPNRQLAWNEWRVINSKDQASMAEIIQEKKEYELQLRTAAKNRPISMEKLQRQHTELQRQLDNSIKKALEDKKIRMEHYFRTLKYAGASAATIVAVTTIITRIDAAIAAMPDKNKEKN